MGKLQEGGTGNIIGRVHQQLQGCDEYLYCLRSVETECLV